MKYFIWIHIQSENAILMPIIIALEENKKSSQQFIKKKLTFLKFNIELSIDRLKSILSFAKFYEKQAWNKSLNTKAWDSFHVSLDNCHFAKIENWISNHFDNFKQAWKMYCDLLTICHIFHACLKL